MLLTAALALSACNYNNPKGGGAEPVVQFSAEELASPDFKVVLRTVIGPKCLGCHSLEKGNKGSTNLETYANVRALGNRIDFRALQKKDMPSDSRLSPAQELMLRTWIDNGFVEISAVVVEKPDPALTQGVNDWAKIRDKVFSKKCAGCHQGATAAKGLDLSDVKMVRENMELILNRSIKQLDMPTPPLAALTGRERRVLLDWYAAGMPE